MTTRVSLAWLLGGLATCVAMGAAANACGQAESAPLVDAAIDTAPERKPTHRLS